MQNGGKQGDTGGGPGRAAGDPSIPQASQPCAGYLCCSLALQVSDRWVPASGPAALCTRGALPARPACLHRRTRLSGQLRSA